VISTRPFLSALLPFILSLFWFAGCASDPSKGYSSKPLFRGDISTVAVPIFENKTVVRDVEFQLTDALIKEIESRTPYKVTSGAHGDTIVLGQIRDVQLDQLSKSRLTGLSEEVILSVTIDFLWKDHRNGKTIVERRSFSGHGLFVPSNPSREPVELGRFAAVKHLARDIVNEMRAEW
jgi:hypothetical protein